MSQPLVSIITPSYNQAAFLEQTLRSVLDQEYPNLEYLVVDGASSDGSTDIIQRYADRLTWWISEPDHGQAEAINKGLSRARGEIVAWLNSDDLYQPGAVSAAVAALEQNPQASFVFADMQAIDGQGRLTNLLHYGNWGLDELMQFNIIGQPAVFMRRSALLQAGLLEPQYHFLLDHQLWLRLALVAEPVYVPQVWAAARFHEAAKNVAQASAFGRDAYAIVDWMQSEPRLEQRFASHRRRIWAGAHRMNARYLLDGGQTRPALRAYGRCFASDPVVALREGHRIAYAFASLFFNVEKLKKWYLNMRRKRVTGAEKKST
jgi:glycosyltransferase involved in cell wall biosynthesis